MDFNSRTSRRNFLAGALTTLCLKLSARADAAALAQPFSFAFVNGSYLCNNPRDSHILYRESLLFLQDAASLINEKNPDFIVCGGNQVEGLGANDANWQLFLDVSESFKAPWSFVLGDRDLVSNEPIDKVKTFGPDLRRLGITTSTPYWSSNMLPGVHIVGLDTSLQGSSQGYIGAEQLNWLKDDLIAHQNDFTIVFSHHPLMSPGSSYDQYVVKQSSVVRGVLQSAGNVSLVVSGHANIRDYQREGRIPYVSGPALAQYPCAFLLFRVDHNSVNIEMCQVRFPALVKKAKQALVASSLASQYNRDDDRKHHDFVIPLTSAGNIPGKSGI